MTKILLSTALIALATIAAPVSASAAPDSAAAPQRMVKFADLDLTTAVGQATLDRRLALAVKSVCPTDDTIDMAQRKAVLTCRNTARNAISSQRNAAIAAAATVQNHALLAGK